MTTTKTACGHFGCDVRVARGLVPFCQMPAPTPTPKVGYSTYAAAVAANPGCRIRSVGGGIHSGGPKRFIAVTK